MGDGGVERVGAVADSPLSGGKGHRRQSDEGLPASAGHRAADGEVQVRFVGLLVEADGCADLAAEASHGRRLGARGADAKCLERFRRVEADGCPDRRDQAAEVLVAQEGLGAWNVEPLHEVDGYGAAEGHQTLDGAGVPEGHPAFFGVAREAVCALSQSFCEFIVDEALEAGD